MTDKKILLIEICNFTDYPIGGYLSFVKQMLTAFGNQLALVGLATDDVPVGEWVKREIDGVVYDYFAVAKFAKTNKKTFIPYRLQSYFAVKKYRNEILNIGVDNVFIQTPEVLFALRDAEIKNMCCRIPGVGNPMTYSRYWYGKLFANVFDFYFFKELKKTNTVLATADKKSINDFIEKSKGKLSSDKVFQFPTRVNAQIFKPLVMSEERFALNLPASKKIIVTTGRISELKGWKFMLDCFIQYRKVYTDSLFIFIGDGEDRDKVEAYITLLGISDSVIITGRVNHNLLAKYLNSADIYIMGSYLEGWATSLVEAISCGKPVVCTNFSSATDLIENGVNGFVVEGHSISTFTDAMIKCDEIRFDHLILKSKSMEQFSTSNLKQSIFNYWSLN